MVSRQQKNYNGPVFFDLPTVFGTWQTVFSQPTICRLSAVIGRRSADTPPTSIYKLNHSNLADCQPIIGPQSPERRQIIFTIDQKSADSRPILVPYKPRPIFLLHSCIAYFELSAFSQCFLFLGGKRLNTN